MPVPKKSKKSGDVFTSAMMAVPPDEMARWSELFSYLLDTVFEDGSPRTTSTINFFLDDGRLKAALNDRDEGCALFASGDGFLSILDSLQAALRSGHAEWRVRGNKPPGRGRGK